jgi:TrmH family RNA methyltransferase
MLTSTKNPRIQRIRKLQNNPRARRKEGLFIVEGVRLVEEALKSGQQPETILFTEDLSERGIKLISGFKEINVDVVSVAPHVMAAASDTQTPQGILAVIPTVSLPIPDPLSFVLIPDGIRDPGNMGTILRTATAAGVDAILLPPGVVDPFSPKVVRSGAGAHFRLPIHSMDWADIKSRLTGLSIFLADSAGGQPHFKSDFVSPLAVIIGSEADGAGMEAHKLASHQVHIPMPGKIESLNAAVATSILLFEVVRQRQAAVSG